MSLYSKHSICFPHPNKYVRPFQYNYGNYLFSRNYAGGTYFDSTSGIVETTICRASQIGATVEVGNAAADDCTNNGVKLR